MKYTKTDKDSLESLTKIFNDRWGIQLNIYPDQFHRTDCWFEWEGDTIDVEVKKRRFNSDKYKTTIINLDKYIELLKRKSILVVMFDDCFYIFKNLKKAAIGVTQMWARKTTDWGGNYIYSDKVELNLDEGKRYDY